jgi:hypothetical protein
MRLDLDISRMDSQETRGKQGHHHHHPLVLQMKKSQLNSKMGLTTIRRCLEAKERYNLRNSEVKPPAATILYTSMEMKSLSLSGFGLGCDCASLSCHSFWLYSLSRKDYKLLCDEA